MDRTPVLMHMHIAHKTPRTKKTARQQRKILQPGGLIDGGSPVWVCQMSFAARTPVLNPRAQPPMLVRYSPLLILLIIIILRSIQPPERLEIKSSLSDRIELLTIL